MLPNATIKQATYHVIAMVEESWQPYVLTVNPGWDGALTLACLRSLQHKAAFACVLIRCWRLFFRLCSRSYAGRDGVDALAVGSDDGQTLVLRVANWAGEPLSFSLQLAASVSPGLRVRTTLLRGVSGAADEENTPGEPERIAPKQLEARDYEPGMLFELPDLSFAVLTLSYDDAPAVAVQ